MAACADGERLIAAQVAAVVVGAALVVYTLGSAIKTVVVPRAYPSSLTRVHFLAWRRVVDLIARPSRSFAQRDGLRPTRRTRVAGPTVR